MSRAERRKTERQYKKLEKKKETLYAWLNTLDKDKFNLIQGEIKRQATEQGMAVMDSLDRCLTATLIEDLDLELTEIQNILEKIVNYMEEDTQKLKSLKNMLGGDFMKKLDEIKEFVIRDAKKMMEGGKKDKEIREKLIESYPQLSKSMITNAVKRVRNDFKTANEVNTVLEAIGLEKATPEELEKANIIESHTKPLEENKDTKDKLIEGDTKEDDKTTTEPTNGIVIEKIKKSITKEVKSKEHKYTIIEEVTDGDDYKEVIREDGVRFSNIKELEKQKEETIKEALKSIEKDFEECLAVWNV